MVSMTLLWVTTNTRIGGSISTTAAAMDGPMRDIPAEMTLVNAMLISLRSSSKTMFSGCCAQMDWNENSVSVIHAGLTCGMTIRKKV